MKCVVCYQLKHVFILYYIRPYNGLLIVDSWLIGSCLVPDIVTFSLRKTVVGILCV